MDLINSIKSTIRIEAVGKFAKTVKKGNKILALCPFHNEKTPSFTIYTESNSFYCWGCCKGGSVIDYIMEVQKVGRRQAIDYLKPHLQDRGLRVRSAAPDPKPVSRYDEELDINKLRRIKSIHRDSVPVSVIDDIGSPIWRYLEGRKIHLYKYRRGISSYIRYHSSLQNPYHKASSGVLVAGGVDNSKLISLSRIWITDLGGKAFSTSNKLSLGRQNGALYPVWNGITCDGEVRSTASESLPERLIITEGIEDALAIATFESSYRIAASCGLSRLRNIRIPKTFCEVILAADRPKTDEHNDIMEGALVSWRQQGVIATIVYPPDGCDDFNDYLCRVGS